MIRLHAVQAMYGDCLILEFGSTSSPKFILIDGGPETIYDDHLKNRLKQIVGNHGTLEALIVSHVDNDHIVGVLDLLSELKADVDASRTPLVNVKELWLNTFTETIDPSGVIAESLNNLFSMQGLFAAMEHTGIIVQGIKEGHQITTLSNALGIPINPRTNNGFYSVENSSTIQISNLKLSVIGPTKENLDELRMKWKEWLQEYEDDIANGKFNVAANADKSVPNLSSIILLAEADGKKILLTGDCRGDHLIQGLKKSGLSQDGKIHVDVLKVQHHGSNRNATKSFFRSVIANTYVISADGKDGNPDYTTLQWIVESAHEDGRNIQLYVTNETDSTVNLINNYDPQIYGYTMHYIDNGLDSVRVL